MKTILSIEDERALQKTLGEALEGAGFRVFSAYDGETGLHLVKTVKPSLVLLDLILPRKNGFDVLGQIKGDPEIKDIPVIILTNLETASDIDRALELGAVAYLVKANYNLSDVVSKIKSLIGEGED